MSCDAESSLVNLVAIFQKYASKDGDSDRLSKSELKELLEKEFPSLADENCKSDEINQIVAQLDQDGDGQVDACEYFTTLAAVGVILFEACKASE